mmetsp:Transcript_33865/g.58995  ORF Transcript_33865/g.58995 Transcript_33865/m.58995 type:complete len:89 (-) Transcript_33865:3062-3328(-)
MYSVPSATESTPLKLLKGTSPSVKISSTSPKLLRELSPLAPHSLSANRLSRLSLNDKPLLRLFKHNPSSLCEHLSNKLQNPLLSHSLK